MFQTKNPLGLMIKKSLTTKIIIWTGLALLVTALAIVSFSVNALRRNAMAAAKEGVHSIAHREAGFIEHEVDKAIYAAKTMAQVLGKVRDPNYPLDIPRFEASNLVRTVLEENGVFLSAFTCWEPNAYDFMDAGYIGESGHDSSGRFAPLWQRDKEGQLFVSSLLASSTHSTNGKPGLWYTIPQKKQKTYVHEPIWNEERQSLVSSISVPIINDDIFYGVVGFDLLLNSMQDYVVALNIFDNQAQIDITSKSGMIICSNMHPELVGNQVESLYGDVPQLVPRIKEVQHVMELTNDNLYHFFPMTFEGSNLNWNMNIVVPVHALTRDITTLMWNQILIFSAIFVVMLCLSLIGTRHIIKRPLNILLEGIKRVTKGDLNHDVKVVSQDEFGQIAEAFNTMRIKLQELIETLHRHQQELEKTVEERTLELSDRNREIEQRREKLQQALDQITGLIGVVVEKGGELDAYYEHPDLKSCWEIMQCSKKECPCFGKNPMRCWQEAASFWHENDSAMDFHAKFEHCQLCSIYQDATRDPIYQIGEHFNNMVHLLKKKNEKLVIAHQQLYQAQKLESVGQLAAGIAHEINTPIQYVGSNIDFIDDAFQDIKEIVAQFLNLLEQVKEQPVLKMEVDGIKKSLDALDWEFMAEEIPQAINQSRDGVQRVSTIVRAMKEFSHPGGKEKSLQDINKIIENTITIGVNEWKYVAELAADLNQNLPAVSCLRDEIGQVILNLLVNAAQAIKEKVGENPEKEKGMITVRTSFDNDGVEIRISDTGQGIPEYIQGRIFEPFFTTKEVGQGSGQGLAIAYDVIAQKHGGTLTFETKEGDGTTFIIRLPI